MEARARFKNVESMKRTRKKGRERERKRGKEDMARKSPTDNPDGARPLRGNRSVDSKNRKRVEARTGCFAEGNDEQERAGDF